MTKFHECMFASICVLSFHSLLSRCISIYTGGIEERCSGEKMQSLNGPRFIVIYHLTTTRSSFSNYLQCSLSLIISQQYHHICVSDKIFRKTIVDKYILQIGHKYIFQFLTLNDLWRSLASIPVKKRVWTRNGKYNNFFDKCILQFGQIHFVI